jgi:glucuronate isomerase
VLHPDRFFDPDPETRRVARVLYEETRALPIVSPHGHVDPRWLAENAAFPEPTGLLIQPDHYLLRVLYSRGIPLERLGIGASVNPREVWRLFAANWYLFRGTPSEAWLSYVWGEVFRLDPSLTPENADRMYDGLVERLGSPEFRPRALFERFNLEVLATTDSATDSLEHHQAIRDSGWNGRVIPTFRPDALFRIAAPEWRQAVALLGPNLASFESFLEALKERRAVFKRMGAVATDHGVLEPYTERLPPEEAEALFRRGREGTATGTDQRRFQAHLLMEMARLSVEDGLVMQLHPGAWRDHNPLVHARFGADRGGDIPMATEFTRNLQPMLAAFGNDSRFTLVLFTLDLCSVCCLVCVFLGV